MKLNKNKIFHGILSGMAAISLLGACTAEDIKSDTSKETDANLELVNLELTLSLPVSTRSFTEKDGSSSDNTLSGFAKENELILANLYFAEVKSDTDPSQDEIVYSLLGVTEIEDGETPVNAGYVNKIIKKKVRPVEFAVMLAGKKLRLYVVGNTPLRDISSLTGEVLSFSSNYQGFLGDVGVTGKNLPLINKATTAILDFSGKSADDIVTLLKSAAQTQDKTFSLNTNNVGGFGTITLERGVARLDYKDKSRSNTGNEESGLDYEGFPMAANVYPLGGTGLYLKVIEMQPVNVSKSEYLFRHTCGGTKTAASNAIDFLKTENGQDANIAQDSYNWIADNDWTFKSSSNGDIATDYFFNQPVKSGDIWSFPGEWTNVSELTSDSPKDQEGYYPWIYLSENTMPSIAKMVQGLSTGVVFKVMLCDAKGKALRGADLLGENVWQGIRLMTTSDQQNISLEYRSGKIVLEKYKDEDAYCMNYLYWVRHNNNTESVEVTDPMEFAVVRNNIYQICITKFEFLPRPYDPEDKDEKKQDTEQDITISVKVKEWNYYRIEDYI